MVSGNGHLTWLEPRFLREWMKMYLLRKIFAPVLVCVVVASLWLLAADRGAKLPTTMRPDGTFVYRDVVASRDEHRPTLTDDATSVMQVVRSLVSG